MAERFLNDFGSAIVPASIAAGATSITVTLGQARPIFNALIANPGDTIHMRLSGICSLTGGPRVEYIEITGVAGDVLTVVRAQDGSIAYDFFPGAQLTYFVSNAILAGLGGGGGGAVTSVAGKTGVVTLDHATDLANIGTSSHATIDAFIAQKHAASGLASLTAGSLVVEAAQNLVFGSDANGDIAIRAGGVYARLGIGSSGQVLTVSAGAPAWAAVPAPSFAIPSVNVLSDAGAFAAGVATTALRSDCGLVATTATAVNITGNTSGQGTSTSLARADHTHAIVLGSDATGDLIYRSGASTWARLGIGSTGQALEVVGGIPAWTTLGAVSSVNVLSDHTTAAAGTATTYLRSDAGLIATTAAPTTLDGSASNSQGTSNSLARADHIHAMPASIAVGTTFTAASSPLTVTQGVATTGNPNALVVTGGAHTTLTNGETTDVNINLARTVQITQGATIASQRAMRIQAPTYSATAATQTITTASTLSISGPPVAGTNVTLTNTYALNVESGNIALGASSLPTIRVTTSGVSLVLQGNRAAGDSNSDIFLTATTNRTAGNLLAISNNNLGTTAVAVAWHGGITVSQAASPGGAPSGLIVTGGAHTLMTASTEVPDVNINSARTVQWATGALTTQRAVLIQAPTYGMQAASTITNAATVAITGAPVQGTNCTITHAYSLWIQAGRPRIDSTTANGSVATVLGSVGPVGSNTTVQEWLTIDINGNARFIPCF